MRFCSLCGGSVEWKIPLGDNRERYVCQACEYIHYENPKVIVGCLPYWNDQVLLCKRAIPPREGWWTIPAGFLENGETVEEGALRETQEEANADVEIIRLFSFASIPRINQVYMIFLAHLKNINFSAGPESLEVKLFRPSEVVWETLAFPSVTLSLERYFADPHSLQIHSFTF